MRLDAGLRAAILTQPADDVPRLIAADWLEEHGDSAQAEFIRTQLRLAALPRWVTVEPTMTVFSHGPRYWECHLTIPVNVGDRVDLLRTRLPRRRSSSRGPLLGLRVRSLTQDTYGATVILVEDEQSGKANPIPELWRLEQRLLAAHGPEWYGFTGVAERPVFRRGFVAEVLCALGDWYPVPVPPYFDAGGWATRVHTPGVGPELLRVHPITTVTVTDHRPTGAYSLEPSTWGWWWYGMNHNDRMLPRNHWWLPPQIFNLLTQESQHGRGTGYPNEQAAMADLSNALITWARQENQ